VPQPVAHLFIKQAVRESARAAVSVSDAEILAEIPRAGQAEGVFFCPEGAACLAALRRLTANEWIHRDNEVLIFNTASGLKYLDVAQGI
jgi:threonine synthase